MNVTLAYKHPYITSYLKKKTTHNNNAEELLCYCLNVLLSLLFKKETFLYIYFCRREENPSDGCLVVIMHNSTEWRF